MIRLISILLFGLLLLNSQAIFADEQKAVSEKTNSTAEEFSEDFNFNDTSYYITEEQLQDAKEIDQIEEKTDFTSKIINSGHFTSETATKTYIPINKILD